MYFCCVRTYIPVYIVFVSLAILGGLSGGGATSRLLVDYPEKQRSQV